ncbi:MAG TPA: hypothetical protein EYH22_01735, partial [Candidatus Nanopusillus sp.]|nr:hypothetical protein [Candidatus Nanopusillus sp.]
KLLEFLEGLPKEDLEKIEIKETKGTGLVSTFLTVYELNLKSKRHIITFLKNLIEKLSSLNELYKNINYDENYSMYIRLDKDLLVNKNIAKPVYARDVFHIKISFNMPHKTEEKVLNELKGVIDKLSQKK